MRRKVNNENWFEDDLRPHEPMMRAWLRARSFPPEDIDEIIQETFMSVLTTKSKEDLKSPKAFLFGMIRNISYSRLRRKYASKQVYLADIEDQEFTDEGPSVEETVVANERMELLSRAIQSLPKRCRQVVTLRKIYGMSNIDIAKNLGISINTVETHGGIGIRKLREFLTINGKEGHFGNV